jgi:hypothetical protein
MGRGNMNKYILIWFLIFFGCQVFAQSDSSKKHGTIKIAKPVSDSVYIKAEMSFTQYEENQKKNKASAIVSPAMAVAPSPMDGNGIKTKFDYNLYFNKNVKVKTKDLADKTTDTVRIQIKVLNNGKPYYKDITPLLILSGVPAYFDEKKNAYKLDALHWKCLTTIKEIEKWKPAFRIVEMKDKFKGQAVIKAKQKKLTATGILTVVFSKLPFEKESD